MMQKAFLIGVLIAASCFGQSSPTFYPSGAHVNLYFPHLADGGPVSAQWQTALEFVNPSATLTANVTLNLYGDDGFPLSLNLGAGSLAIHTFTIPPNGTIILRSTISSGNTVTGRATATSDIPIQGTVLFRNIVNGSVFVEVSAPATLPTTKYISLATRDLGIAIGNVSGVSKSFQIAAVNSSGSTFGTALVTVAGFGHQSFNLSQTFPTMAASFSGSVVITPQVAGDQMVAWTLNADRSTTTILPTGLISTLPSGPLDWPISHADRIQLVFKRLLAGAPSVTPNLNLSLTTAPTLTMPADLTVNAVATSTQTVQINLALSELVSDSPSELAFLVAHELGHISQYRSGTNTVLLTNKEDDADLMAMILVLNAGFDPYGAAGAIAKLGAANAGAGVVSQFFDNLADPTPAFSAVRLNSIPGLITSACSTYVPSSSYCANFKAMVHPHFPASATF